MEFDQYMLLADQLVLLLQASEITVIIQNDETFCISVLWILTTDYRNRELLWKIHLLKKSEIIVQFYLFK